MSALKVTGIAAALFVAAGAGLWAGQTGLIKIPVSLSPGSVKREDVPNATGPVIYYRDPTGKPFYAPKPKATESGQPYIAVHASEDLSFEPTQARQQQGAAARKIKFYRNPMGLPDISPAPKKDAMGMDYIPVYDGEESDGASVQISPGKLQRTGVETVTIEKRPITRVIRAPGVIAIDERRVAVIAPRFDGYVVKVGPATTGTHVMKGDVLAEVFGQEVLNQAARLLVERDSRLTSNDEARPDNLTEAGGLIGAKRRLQNLGVPEEFIHQVARERRVPDTFQYRAPIDGDVLERNWSDGQGFKSGDVGFRIADHSVVWMMADVAEGDIGALQVGQKVKVTTRAHPGRIFTGTVAVIYPHLMRETRTVRVRIELPNPDMALLPDMYGDVEIATGSNANVLALPASSIIDSGRRRIVFVDRGEGRFEPREVKSGRRGNGFVEVLAGLAEGDKVVSNGNFLLDAESNLQSALKGFAPPPSNEEASQ